MSQRGNIDIVVDTIVSQGWFIVQPWVLIILIGVGFVTFVVVTYMIERRVHPRWRETAVAFLSLSLGSAIIFVGLILMAQLHLFPKRPEIDTSGRPSTEDAAQQSEKTAQGSKPPPKPEEPLTVESTTCLLTEAQTSEPKVSTAETSELQVTVSVPSNARECHDTVTIDAPTFGLGKEARQPISVVRPEETHVARWLLDPEKPGRWNIAVETDRDRELVPVAVTTPLGFPATWVQAGAFIAGAATIIFGVLAFLRRGQ
jgi:hypothetical protein